MGICPVLTRDAVIAIAGVSDASTSAGLGSVSIRQVTLSGGAVLPLERLLAVSAPVHNVTVSGDELVCTVVCGFGDTSGTYGMTLHHDGYRDTTLTLVATYGRKESSRCTVTYSQGTVFELRMQPL